MSGDDARHERWRRERRAVVRRHHPDVGGDPAVLQALLEDVDRRHGVAAASPDDPLPAVRPTPRLRRLLRSARRTARHGTRTVRTRIPTGWPGRRRYLDL